MARRKPPEAHGLSVRAVALRIGKAPQTVAKMVENGELRKFVVLTEAGHSRDYITLASLESWETSQDFAA